MAELIGPFLMLVVLVLALDGLTLSPVAAFVLGVSGLGVIIGLFCQWLMNGGLSKDSIIRRITDR